jgi:hypothetical protein
MQQDRFFFRAGAWVWVAGGIAHLVLVDALTLHGRSGVSAFLRHADILDTMASTTLSFGVLGSTTAFLALAGFSIWVALSLVLFGLVYLLLSRQGGIALRPFAGMGFVVSATFSVIAAMCFIYPAAIGGAMGTLLFAVSWIRDES